MSALGGPSRFSLLRIDDDSSEDEFTMILKGKNKAGGNAKGGKTGGRTEEKKQPTSNAKKKAKNKKTKKPNVEATVEEWEKVDSKLVKKQFEDDLKNAVEASQETFQEEQMIRTAIGDEQGNSSLTSGNKKQGKKKAALVSDKVKSGGIDHGKGDSHESPSSPPLLHPILSNADEEVERILRRESAKEAQANRSKINSSESAVIAMFRNKLEEVAAQLTIMTAATESHKNEAKKYKDRYKKLCEILKDAEVKDKAQLIVEVENTQKIRDELTDQICELNAQLEQARSKIHDLESESLAKKDK